MGLLTSVNNINYKLEEEKKAREEERKAKEKERKHIQEEKENMNYIKNKILNFLRIKFQEKLYLNSSIIYEFYNINKKESLFNEFYNNLAMKENIKMDYKPFILDFFNSNYYKILKQVEAEAKKNEEYKIYKHITTLKEEFNINYDINNTNNINNINNINYKQIKKEKQQRILKAICYTFAGIIFLPMGFILLILYFTFKKQK